MDESIADNFSTAARTEQQYLDHARDLGFIVIDSLDMVNVTNNAAQALPNSKTLVPAEIIDGYLVCVTTTFPTAQEFQKATEDAGMPLSITVAPKAIYDNIKARYKKFLDDVVTVKEDTQQSYVTYIFDQVIASGTSDLHISVGSEPRIRKGAKLIPLPGSKPLVAEEVALWSEFLIGPEVLQKTQNTPFDTDKTVTYGGYRWRVSGFKQRNSYAFSLRRINPVPMTITELGLPTLLSDLCDLPSGFVVISGPTNSGKSTSSAAMIDRINEKYNKHIITIEDPVEYQHANKKSLVQQREVGKDTETFNKALRHALRQDPDVILVGEMRDHETISTALTAAETGHLVITTLHAQSAAGVVSRIIDVFPSEQQAQIRVQLANTLKAVIAQSLLPSARSESSRELVAEILHVTPATANLIREQKTHQIEGYMETGGNDRDSMGESKSKVWDKALAEAYVNGRISERTANENVRIKDSFETYSKKLRSQQDSFYGAFEV